MVCRIDSGCRRYTTGFKTADNDGIVIRADGSFVVVCLWVVAAVHPVDDTNVK